MIGVEGRILRGLDEFMLRIGHLRTLCSIIRHFGGSWYRVQRALSTILTRPVPLTPETSPAVAAYLFHKKLCPVDTEATIPSGSERKYRYPYLAVTIDQAGTPTDLKCTSNRTEDCSVWWQDTCLSAPGVPSRVGAVTATGKSGSKTGVSHICDWAQIISLVSTSAQLSAEGQLLAKLHGGYLNDQGWIENPYGIHFDRIIVAYVILSSDFDIFSRLIVRLAREAGPIRKAHGCQLFVSTFRELVNELEQTPRLPSSQRFHVLQQYKELEDAAKKGGDISKTSLAWHRASSRLENYVDFGLMMKGHKGEHEQYEYTYYPGKTLARVGNELQHQDGAIGWLEDNLAALVFDHDYNLSTMSLIETHSIAEKVAAVLNRTTGVFPVTALALGIVSLKAEQGEFLAISVARKCLMELAQQRPDLARLSRGGYGKWSEFISLIPRRKQ